MKIEYPQKKISKLTQQVLEHLETSPVAVVQFDDSPDQQKCREELHAMDGFSCLRIYKHHKDDPEHILHIINVDWPHIEVELD